MESTNNNIYPIFDRMLQRDDREAAINQRGVVLWFTGLSGSGKSTLAIALERELFKDGYMCRLLDGDNIRAGINNNLGFSQEDRVENIRRIAEISKLFAESGVVTISSFISPTNDIRDMASEIIGKEDFLEVFISTPIEVCEERDVKGLYKKARAGEIKDFTGISSPFEEPKNPFISIDTSLMPLKECVEVLKKKILSRITYTQKV